MEPSRFDELTKALATSTSRRQALKAIAATTLGGILGLGGIGTAFGKPKCHSAGLGCDTNSNCCPGLYCANNEKCTPCPALPACNSGCPCPSGQTCSNGQCVTPPPQSQPFCLCSDGTALAGGCTDLTSCENELLAVCENLCSGHLGAIGANCFLC